MSYSEFTLTSAKQKLGLTTYEEVGIFANTPELESSNLLRETIAYNLPMALASNSEKARSELLIAPILTDLRRQLHNKVNLFSGVEFHLGMNYSLYLCAFAPLREIFIPSITNAKFI